MNDMNILAFYAHPADSATAASGTVALHAERGDRVTSVVASYGDRHHMQWLHDEEAKPKAEQDPAIINMTLEEYRTFKKRESERIADVLGVSDLQFLEWTDSEIYFSNERVMEVAEVILRVRPDIVLTAMPFAHGHLEDDHPNVTRIVMKAIATAANRVRQFDGVEPFRGVKQVFYYFAGGEESNSRSLLGGGVVPDVWIDTTPVIEKKVHAFDQLVSQGYQGDTARWIIEARDGRWGMIAGCSYAEPFLRPDGITYDHLPMPERVLGKQYVATPSYAGRTTAHSVPSGTPDLAYRLDP